MKRVLAVLMFVCLAGPVSAEPAKAPNPGIGGPRSDIPNEAAIRKLYAEFTRAWNKHDVNAMVAMWAPDGDHQEPDGRLAKGRKGVKELLGAEHSGVFKSTHLTLNVGGVWFINSTVALADGTYELSGVIGAEGKEIAPRKGHLTSILLYEQGRWWIAASRAMIPVPLVWRPH